MTLPERIATKIGPVDSNGCWPWIAFVGDQGYGRVWWKRCSAHAHRVVYELLVGPIADGLQIDHLCRVRHCVNPAHMELVTQAENKRRGIGPWAGSRFNASKMHCPHGHPYDETNTIHKGDGSRVCRTCNRTRCAAYYHRRPA